MGEKACTRCEKVKPLEMFSKLLNGHHSWCKACRSETEAAKNLLRARKRQRKKKFGDTDEIWPRKLTESLLDIRAKKWGAELKYPAVMLTPGVELQLAASITRTGQLRPIVTVELEAAA